MAPFAPDLVAQFDRNIHYANRRSKRDDMDAYLMQKTDLPKTIFND